MLLAGENRNPDLATARTRTRSVMKTPNVDKKVEIRRMLLLEGTSPPRCREVDSVIIPRLRACAN